jgi:hypothetical protein
MTTSAIVARKAKTRQTVKLRPANLFRKLSMTEPLLACERYDRPSALLLSRVYRTTALRESTKFLQYDLRVGFVKASTRLVSQQDLGGVQQRSRNTATLAFSNTQLTRIVTISVHKAELLQQ